MSSRINWLRDVIPPERINELEKSDVGGRTIFSHEERYRPLVLTALALLAALVALAALRGSVPSAAAGQCREQHAHDDRNADCPHGH